VRHLAGFGESRGSDDERFRRGAAFEGRDQDEAKCRNYQEKPGFFSHGSPAKFNKKDILVKFIFSFPWLEKEFRGTGQPIFKKEFIYMDIFVIIITVVNL
jgi:hypothetical protein